MRTSGCRTAIRILKPISNFPADSERALYDGVRQIDWSRFLDTDRSLAIDPVVWSSFCTHSLFVAQLSKDAIVDQFRDRTGQRPSVDRNEPDLRINIHLVENVATVYLDSSGDSLHLRGYRAKTGEAPLGEVLAAGILQLTEWDRQSTLVDPMCGSGTLCIEAALLARNIVPGVKRRRFGFTRWNDYEPPLHDEVLAELRHGELPSLPFSIVGSDIDAEVVPMAQENARRAGVAADVRFEAANFECCQPPMPTGTLVMNPPYDERLKVDRIAAPSIAASATPSSNALPATPPGCSPAISMRRNRSACGRRAKCGCSTAPSNAGCSDSISTPAAAERRQTKLFQFFGGRVDAFSQDAADESSPDLVAGETSASSVQTQRSATQCST